VEVMEAIQSRRSIRRYQDIPVDDKAVAAVLEAARWAPSWVNTQCWRFIVVRESDTKSRLADTLIANPDIGEKNPADKAIRTAPVVIVACAELGKSGFYHGEASTDKGDWYMFDVALAMQNLTLAAHSLGLSTVHVGSLDGKKAAEVLNVPQGFCVVEMTPLGYPDQQPKPRPRKELAEMVFYDTWGNK